MRVCHVVLAAATFAVAATAAPAAGSEQLEQVVVTATRIPTPEDHLASSVTVITAEDIAAKQERTLTDVLQDVPGLNVVQVGGPGGQTSLFIRGTNSNHTKVFIDGIDVGDPSNSTASFDAGQLLTPDIERVEVLRGPQSGLYGADAIGGVINVITKSGSGPVKLSAGIEGGNFDTFNQAASVNGQASDFHYAANIEHLHVGATPVTPLDLLAPGEQRIDDYYDNVTASTKLGLDVTNDFSLSLVGRYANTHLRTTGSDDVNFGFPDPEQSQSNATAYSGRASARLLSFDGFLDDTLGVAYTHYSTLSITPGFADVRNTGDRTKVDWQGALKFSERETLLLGAETERDEISDPVSASTRINSGYTELQSQLGDSFFSAVNLRYDDSDQFGSKVTYRIAPTYVIAASGTQLKASLGTGFKPPTLSELFQSFPPFFFANPNLKAETSTGYDVGIEQAWSAGAVRAGATYFHNSITNLITTDETGTTYANVGHATTDGVESFLAWQAMKTLMLRLDYTYTEATDDVLHEELLRRPKHKGTVQARWQASTPLSFAATVLWVGSWVDGNRDFSVPRLEAPGYTVVNVTANYDLSDQLSLFGRINNLFDRQYQEPVGFMKPGIGAVIGLKATF
ncbi:MAG TPA: TonB-dependent receptor [Steroidobacteraceae bacterium]|nr:TonB-dependent receptor [Steroidobacteraceae bacterium]